MYRKLPFFFCIVIVVLFIGCSKYNSEKETLPLQEETVSPRIETLPEHDKQLTTLAKVLAGMPVQNDARFTKVTSKKTWFLYKTIFGNIWDDFIESRSTPMNEWSKKNLKDVHKTSKTVFYPFGGPDFALAYSIFPNANRYILMGLEPVGIVPNVALLSDTTFKSFSKNMINSMKTYCSFGFFITKEMQQDLSIRSVNGVLPIIMIMMAREEILLHNITPIYLDSNANKIKRSNSTKGINSTEHNGIEGIEILFSKKGKKKIDVCYYFKTDLSNASPTAIKTIESFLHKTDDSVVTFLKAASYLMHNTVFSKIQDMILQNSTTILQDDSGIPIKAMDTTIWDIELYGVYTKPIGVFKHQYQQQMFKQYALFSKGQFMFGYGYKHTPGSSNIQVFQKREKQ